MPKALVSLSSGQVAYRSHKTRMSYGVLFMFYLISNMGCNNFNFPPRLHVILAIELIAMIFKLNNETEKEFFQPSNLNTKFLKGKLLCIFTKVIS